MASSHITPRLYAFLNSLAKNNDRTWFEANREQFECDVRTPLLSFISDFDVYLRRLRPHFVADARKVGGSLFRIHRDVRFSKDKSPYKTNVVLSAPAAAQFVCWRGDLASRYRYSRADSRRHTVRTGAVARGNIGLWSLCAG